MKIVLKKIIKTKFLKGENKMKKIGEKLKKFESLCGDWDYRRNIDMTEPHLQSINIEKNYIVTFCEIFSPELDDYVICFSGKFENKSLIKKFKKLNLSNKNDVLDFISKIDNLIDWDEVNEDLNEQKEAQVASKAYFANKEETDEFDEYIDDVETTKVPAKQLGEGWSWVKYSDGSGHLESPDGKEYMIYDLSTNEYKIKEEDNYTFFPLSYYYADGYEPSKFNPFSYMEEEMIDYVLPREEKEKTL